MTVLAQPSTMLAHAGGLPEAAMVGAPVLTLVVFLLLERRARRAERQVPEDERDS